MRLVRPAMGDAGNGRQGRDPDAGDQWGLHWADGLDADGINGRYPTDCQGEWWWESIEYCPAVVAKRLCSPRTSQTPWTRSGRERQGARSLQGITELVLPGPALGKIQSEAVGLAGEASGQGEEASPQGLGSGNRFAECDARLQRARLWAMTCTASQAALARKRPEGRWFRPTPYFRSRMAFSISAWRRWSASKARVSPSRSLMKA